MRRIDKEFLRYRKVADGFGPLADEAQVELPAILFKENIIEGGPDEVGFEPIEDFNGRDIGSGD